LLPVTLEGPGACHGLGAADRLGAAEGPGATRAALVACIEALRGLGGGGLKAL